MLETRHLRYFIAVAEELNFSRAADRLHMAQPPLSAAIRQLEREMQTELLLRTTRQVSLTDAGHAFLRGAYRVVEALDRASDAVRRVGLGGTGSLRLAFCCGTRVETLPTLAAAFGESFPEAELQTEEMWNADTAAALRSGRIDVAIGVCPEINEDVRYEPIRHEPLIGLVPADHPLSGVDELSLEDLASDTFLFLPREVAPRFHDTLYRLCRRAGFEPNVRYGGIERPWELTALAELGLVALMPASVGTAAPPQVAAIRVSNPSDFLETAIVSRPDETSILVQALRAVAATLFVDAQLAMSNHS